MRLPKFNAMVLLTFLIAPTSPLRLYAQQPPTASPEETPCAAPAADASPLSSQPPDHPIIVPAGTRLPLVLRNAVDTRTAKNGDSVYFQTTYPIAANNRMAIPMGTFVRGKILEAKRPGRIRGRGELRLALEQMTYPNGYTIELRASPSSVDPHSGSGVNPQKTIEGPSSSLRDSTSVLWTAAGGAFIGTLAGAAAEAAPGKGALIGGGIGGITGLIAVLATRGPEAELSRGTVLDVVFDRPLLLDAALLPSTADPGTDPQARYAASPVDVREREMRRNHASPPRLLPLRFLPLLR